MTCEFISCYLQFRQNHLQTSRQWDWSSRGMELDTFIVGRMALKVVGDSCATSLFTAGTLTGFDASGHIAEETKNARCTVIQ